MDLYNKNGSPKKCEQCVNVDGEYCNIKYNKEDIIIIPAKNGFCQTGICNYFKDKKENL